MKQGKKTSFYLISAVLTFALVLGACPNDTSTKPKDTSVLKLSGQVYILNTDLENIDYAALMTGKNIAKTDIYKENLDIDDGGLGGSGKITKGKLSYTIGVPLDLSPINEDGSLDYLKERYSSLKFSSEDVNAAVVVLETPDSEEYSGLFKGLLGINLESTGLLQMTLKITIKMVNYIYVDSDLKITADADSFEYENDELGFPIVLTSEKINLNLKKGWNALYEEITAQSDIPPELIPILMGLVQDSQNPLPQGPDLSALRPTGNLKMSVGDPDKLNWTLLPSQSPDDDDDDDDIEPQYP